ncbi:unnamed protein product [Staurois parvus]|uniref:Transcription factor CBF/NF-Y/archaeal histone domain-containing protein n=1 Tax=Staurois parvus TaxID=386267 RepID=A0ABN9D7Z2_9NEOB|nr:unnamed protein product [Staurois parvus]
MLFRCPSPGPPRCLSPAVGDAGRCSPCGQHAALCCFEPGELYCSRTEEERRMAESRMAESRLVVLPQSRIRVIMKSSPDVSSINPDALLLTTKATELFVKYLASYSYKHGTGNKDNTLAYDDLSDTAENSDIFGFLSGRWMPLTFIPLLFNQVCLF